MITAFLRLIRFNNLLIMLFTQVLSYYFLSPHIGLSHLLETRFIFLCLATLLVGAGGYIINDYLDVKLDLINKPSKVVVGQIISRRWTMFLHFSMNAIAVVLGLGIGTKVTLAIIVAALLLWIYSVSLKRQFLAGNVLVSCLSAFVIVINYLYDNSLQESLIWAYSFFAFMLTLLREIIKDTEDIRGDGKFDCKTIPIVIGVRRTKILLQYATGVFAILLFVYTSFYAAAYPFEYTLTRGSFIFYMITFVIIPLLILLYFIKTADTSSDFHRLSTYTKLIMVTGMLSMIFWKL
ncbi:MAG: geranylgeranylglycerol-phosphate geranylgeranyltransferase [Bacteroidota bacterium]